VGKTGLIRDLARRHGKQLLELNMERRLELADHFKPNDPRHALADLAADLGHCHDILCKARICHRVEHTAANGLPLGAETKGSLFKSILADIGLVSMQLGLFRLDFRDADHVIWANKGGLAEQSVGQQLRCLAPAYEDPRLFYWQRTEGRQGEIDYLIQQGSAIITVEVKAGSSGSMNSLHAFIAARKLDRAIRLDINPPSVQLAECKTTTGEPVSHQLLSLPFYMVESIPAALAARMDPR
jgi:hypothetical protein